MHVKWSNWIIDNLLDILVRVSMGVFTRSLCFALPCVFGVKMQRNSYKYSFSDTTHQNL